MSSCAFLQHLEKYNNLPRYREIDKDIILDELRSSKMGDMQRLLQSFEEASDPRTLMHMFIHRDNVDREYEHE